MQIQVQSNKIKITTLPLMLNNAFPIKYTNFIIPCVQSDWIFFSWRQKISNFKIVWCQNN